MNKIKVVVVDDYSDIREYFKLVLSKEPDICVVGEALDSETAYNIVKETQPDIVLMDIQMETEYAGFNAIKKINRDFPNIKNIVLTMHDNDELLFKAYGIGAVDYIIKSSSIADTLSSIRLTYQNKFILSPNNTTKLLYKFKKIYKERENMPYLIDIASKLTHSEFQILYSVYEGLSYSTIAKSRHVEIGTVKLQANKIIKKFDQTSMKSFVKTLSELGFFEIYKSMND